MGSAVATSSGKTTHPIRNNKFAGCVGQMASFSTSGKAHGLLLPDIAARRWAVKPRGPSACPVQGAGAAGGPANFLLVGEVMIKMNFDSDEYMNALRVHKRAMGFHTLRDAEISLFPIRARKRQMKREERIELEATCKTKRGTR
jgi:hypothetical protein